MNALRKKRPTIDVFRHTTPRQCTCAQSPVNGTLERCNRVSAPQSSSLQPGFGPYGLPRLPGSEITGARYSLCR
ncbi:hypothetical protein DPMN_038130 [Dreissena polymorpha]|uniref:Uncharacterized protein n=1 Tax=Dreissena polymorpha TaxID=45954 RepID=A0A9D4RQE7_DREPO|nr:hypothetical protein DPMN_038130 [Dreissena polymorpha]